MKLNLDFAQVYKYEELGEDRTHYSVVIDLQD